MILRRLRLHPFGCFADREVRFEPGLNVVLGPNEAGKSTLFHAARTALLRTRLDKKDLAKFIARFVPATGGDTVGVEADFETPEGCFALRRRWGGSPASELVLPDGAAIRDDEGVRNRLESLLPAKQGSFWKVLFTSQTELAEAVASLEKEGRDAVADLSDILRRAVLETGGVSADGFRAALEERTTALLDNWDTARSAPRDNRGIERPWQRNVGRVLEAFYEREKLKQDLRQSQEIERGIDKANDALRRLEREIDTRQRFLSENRKACDDARKRAGLEAEQRGASAASRELEGVATAWPVASSDAERLGREAGELAERVAALRAEKAAAEADEAHAKLRDKVARVGAAAKRLRQAEGLLAAAPATGRTEIEAIRAASQAVETLRAGLEAAHLRVSITAREGGEIAVERDGAAPETVGIVARAETTIEADWGMRILHPSFDIVVRSGGEEAERRQAELAAAAAHLAGLLSAAGAPTVAVAEELHRSRESLAAASDEARSSLDQELGGESAEELAERNRAAGAVQAERPLGTVAGELGTAESRLEGLRREKAKADTSIAQWEKTYGSLSGLYGALGAAKQREKDVHSALAAAAPLPAGYADADAFVAGYERAREELDDRKELQRKARSDKDGLELRLPTSSAEELAVELEQAETRFRSRLERGTALLRVRAETDRVLAASDAAIYTGMREELGRLVAAMTGDRYGSVDMESALPRGLVTRGGARLGWERLSAGTRDLLALALRLVMAARFLGTASGFAMLDDPLVEMDPERQALAALALRAFAEDRQLVVFTCHPAHAELLGGNRITLGTEH